MLNILYRNLILILICTSFTIFSFELAPHLIENKELKYLITTMCAVFIFIGSGIIMAELNKESCIKWSKKETFFKNNIKLTKKINFILETINILLGVSLIALLAFYNLSNVEITKNLWIKDINWEYYVVFNMILSLMIMDFGIKMDLIINNYKDF